MHAVQMPGAFFFPQKMKKHPLSSKLKTAGALQFHLFNSHDRRGFPFTLLEKVVILEYNEENM